MSASTGNRDHSLRSAALWLIGAAPLVALSGAGAMHLWSRSSGAAGSPAHPVLAMPVAVAAAIVVSTISLATVVVLAPRGPRVVALAHLAGAGARLALCVIAGVLAVRLLHLSAGVVLVALAAAYLPLLLVESVWLGVFVRRLHENAGSGRMMPFDPISLLASGSPVSHVVDKPIFNQMFFSNVTLMVIVSAVVTALIVIPAARRIATGPGGSVDDMRAQGAWANFVEAVCLYLRDEVFKPILGEDTDRFIGILWTFFWFILVCNVLGLVPLLDITGGLLGMNMNPEGVVHGFGGTATQSIWVTGALAFLAFLMINGVALARDPIGYFTHLTGGAPWFMWPIIIPVEFAGIFIKPFALALRLFANMSGGHVMLAVLFSFVPSLIKALGVVGYGVALVPLLGATAIYMLEVLVAFIQAFIFTFLTGMFLGQLIAHGHDDDHGHAEAHAPAGAEH